MTTEGWDVEGRPEVTEGLIQAAYAERMALVAELVTDVRVHRAEGCPAQPFCPGREAASKINIIPPGEWADLLLSVLNHAADLTSEAESLRVQLDQERARVRTIGAARAEAERDRDAGWMAYRSVTSTKENRDAPPAG